MNFSSFVILLLIVLVFSLAMPLLSNIGTFKVTKNDNKKITNKDNKSRNLKFNLKDQTKATAFSSNRAGKLETDQKTGLKRRVIAKYDSDPNSFDFDVDELINEDLKEELEQEQKRLEQFNSKSNEEIDELV
ncbi:hypothetical protein Kpol_1003p54 [Vanderwaltozyma polyspora DSM 70294]|uniref:Uncharacterized protein n=1 Tax=Vanderwaltozyma polyspora (strain ATCC 22028 / DSM 70294 / BCRC 21397 / CBS 2163 / NBRC 10782 / NRRL Y-8283 / UCD 57-17) TaxID=436907 RepID=A7TM11_VANPO|nr:uncharacterized protein Kpol_1003p54 [Vanderwaltozyma polyspora DSM 70294]EDO16748.1 hypothetical protein Kpol_1003p54 [Vanderwaltozyma polyspora DSM 70294]